ncbi:MAG: hypothetical protein AAGI01_17035 [Myxococcota bacterium]
MRARTPLMSALLIAALATALACKSDPPKSTYKTLEEQGFLDEDGNVVRDDPRQGSDSSVAASSEEERRRAGFIDVNDLESGELDPPPTAVVGRELDDRRLHPPIPEPQEGARPEPQAPPEQGTTNTPPTPLDEPVLGLTREQIRAQFGGEIAEDKSGGYVPTDILRTDDRAPAPAQLPSRETAGSRKATKLKPGVKGQTNIPGLPQIPMTQKNNKKVVAPSDAPASDGTVVRP